jgi:hypothetical protein
MGSIGLINWLWCLILYCAMVMPVYGQSTLTGKLTDRKTGEPVPFANVFFAHTTLGTSSLPDGSFSISRIPKGKYDLVIEFVGYKHHKQPIEFEQGNYKIDILMDQDTIQLDSITIVADQSDKRYLPVFVRFFVGDIRSAKACKILNPEVLHFYFDDKRNYLTVSARKPVQVLNPELGYKVHYTLDRFGLDFTTGEKMMQGSPRFEELPFTKRKDSVTREKKRTEAYQGSLFHFMRALYSNTLEDERFLLYIADSLTSSGGSNEALSPFVRDSLVTGEHVINLNYTGLLKLEYRKSEDLEYPGRMLTRYHRRNPNGFQNTYLLLKDPSLQIYENGYFSDQLSVYLNGYLVWRETVANMVPLGHEVVRKKKAKKKKGP